MVDIMFQKCALLAMSKIPQNMPEKSLSMLPWALIDGSSMLISNNELINNNKLNG